MFFSLTAPPDFTNSYYFFFSLKLKHIRLLPQNYIFSSVICQAFSEKTYIFSRMLDFTFHPYKSTVSFLRYIPLIFYGFYQTHLIINFYLSTISILSIYFYIELSTAFCYTLNYLTEC